MQRDEKAWYKKICTWCHVYPINLNILSVGQKSNAGLVLCFLGKGMLVTVTACTVSSSPEQRYLEILILRPWVCDLVWRQNLCRFKKYKMRTLGCTLKQHDRYSYENGEMWTQT